MPKPITPFLFWFTVSIFIILRYIFIEHGNSLFTIIYYLVFWFFLIAFPLLIAGIRIVPLSHRAVVFRLDKNIGVFGPGIILVDPLLDKVYRVNMKERHLKFKLQDTRMTDATIGGISVIITYRFIDPVKIIQMKYYKNRLVEEIQDIVRKELSGYTTSEFYSEKSSVEKRIMSKLREIFHKKGMEILNLELKVG